MSNQPLPRWPTPAAGQGGAGALAGRLLPLRPMTVGDVLDGAFRALRGTLVPILIVVVLVLAPYHLLSNLLLYRLMPAGMGAFDLGGFEAQPTDIDMGQIGALFGGIGLVAIVGLLVNLLVASAVVALVLQVDRGEPADVGASLRTALRCFGSTVGASLLLGVGALAVAAAGLVVSLLLLFIPIVGWIALPVGFVVVFGLAAGLFALVVPIAVTERSGPIATLGRAFWVLRVRFWRLLGITLLVMLVVTLVTFGVTIAFGIVSLFAGPAAWFVESVANVLASIVQVPVITLAALLVYLDARVRHEGYDLEVRAGSAQHPGA